MGCWSHQAAALVRWATRMSTGPSSEAIFCFSPLSSFVGRNLAKFNRMCMKYNQIKNGKKSQSQKVNWLMRNLAQLISSTKASCLVPQYRCCCKSCRWWHILIFAMDGCGCHTIFVDFSILSIFSMASSPVSISSCSNSNSRPTITNRPTCGPGEASQLCQPAVGGVWIFLGTAGVVVPFSSSSLWFYHNYVIKIGTFIWQGSSTAGSCCAKKWATWLHRGIKQLCMPSGPESSSFLTLPPDSAQSLYEFINLMSFSCFW